MANLTDKEKILLERFGKDVQRRYIEGLQRVRATGASQKSISYVVTEDGVRMIAGLWFPAIDFGRGRARKGTGKFKEAIKKWIVKKDDFKMGWRAKMRERGISKSEFKSSTKVNLDNAAKSLAYKINRYGTFGNVFGKDRKILSSIDTTDLQDQLVQDLGREWVTKIANAIVYDSRFQFIDVKLTKKG